MYKKGGIAMVSDKLQSNIEQLAESLKEANTSEIKTLIGIDGFVDEIIHVVDKRKNAEEYTRIKTIKEYGERILKAAGLSTNFEMVPIQVKLGGNGPILSNALIKYGADVTYIGALGVPNINPVFKEMVDKCTPVSIANPSHTDAVEFEDGKLIISKLEAFKAINWENIKSKIGVEKLASMIEESTLFGLENWTMIPYMSEIWKGIIDEVFPLINTKREKNLMFFDLADPEKRDDKDILEALELIKQFSSKFKVILGLNKKESAEIAKVLGLDKYTDSDYHNIDLQGVTENIAKKLGIYCLVVHPVSEAAAYCNGIYYHTEGPYTPNPKLTTGAGDNFNAGFCVGQALGLSVQLSLVLGVATSGYYVRNAKSPTKEELIKFLNVWKNS